MATAKICNGATALKRVNEEIVDTTDITNNLGSVFYAGVIVEETVGTNGEIREKLDPATTVEVGLGETVTIDPTGITGAVGTGVVTREEQMLTTTVEILVRNVTP